ncbi:transmembrane protein 104 homolog [Chelonus insularis]|uniref:transmembrane protein 104 homolog n=1 Tax=Chelonus insularis TaxID=460826 RepID=UPI00158E3C5B|nr:transmembrane protein 104 homolog [Chelonus insularis]
MPQINTDQYSTKVGLIYIFNLIVGTGALTLPAVFSRAGWLFGTTVIIILGFISFITVTFVIESMASASAIIAWEKVQSRKKALRTFCEAEPPNSDSEETPLVEPSGSSDNTDDSSKFFTLNDKVEIGEMASLFFSKTSITLFYICLAVYLYGDLSIYAAAIGRTLADVACNYQPANFTCNETIPDTEACWEGSYVTRFDAYQIFLTTFVLISGPFVFFNVQKTKYLQILTSTMRWLAFSIMIIYALRILIVNGPQGSPPAMNVYGIPGLFGACIYSFMCHHSLPALVVPITNKSTLNRALILDYVLIAGFYLLLALTGTFAFAHLDDLYTLDFGPRGSGGCSENTNTLLLIIEYFLALFPVFTLSTSFPIIAITLRNNLSSLFLNNQTAYNFCLRKLVFPFLAIIPPYVIAMSTENLSFLVSITGSYAGAGIQYLIPTFLVLDSRKKVMVTFKSSVKNRFASPFAGKYWPIFVIVWAVACMILVTINFVEKKKQFSTLLLNNALYSLGYVRRHMVTLVGFHRQLRVLQSKLIKLIKHHIFKSSSLTCSVKYIIPRFFCNSLSNMHSTRTVVQGQNMTIEILPALDDNFMYLIIDKKTNDAAIVDPVNSNLVSSAVEEHQVNLKKILTTHHHWDHAGGNKDMRKIFKEIEVLGGDQRVEAVTKIVSHGDIVDIGDLKVKCLATPCHTSDHICYYLSSENDSPVVFTGDTLFIGGCGRFFEGTAEQMYKALCEILGSLPDKTKVYCGHEYSCKNLQFGLKVEPGNEDIKRKLDWFKELRKKQSPTVPSTIGEEKKINPFMRVHEQMVMAHTGTNDPIKTMAALRKEKDKF